MNDIHAPYNFAPLSKTVLRWGPDAPSQDTPYQDGLCGEIELVLTAETPLLVGGEQKGQEKSFARGKDGRPEIPGSSLRGMIRSLVEILSFSAIGAFVEDRSFGLRDLSGPSAESYRRKFQRYGAPVAVPGRPGQTVSVSRGGWLVQEGGSWKIEPCRVERVRYEALFQIAKGFEAPFQRLRETPKIDAKQAPQIYALWRAAKGGLDEAALAHQGGVLVFTGNPSYNRHNPRPNKKGEFLFLPSSEPALDVPDEVWRGFLDVHERQEKPSQTWMWWKKRLGLERWDPVKDHGLPQDPTSRIPVFYLEDRGEALSLGLAQMFKMHGLRAHEALPGAHLPQTAEPDLAERVFGRIGAGEAESFRGRVSFSAGRLAPDSPSLRETMHETVGAAPKAGFFPAYLRQRAPSPGGRRAYVTWSDDPGLVELKGWKRYPAQIRKEGYAPPPPPERSGEASRARLKPIQAQKPGEALIFRSILRFHNLRPYELGALLWALTWGGDAEKRHALGMGKPWGWGRVKIDLGELKARPNDPASPAAPSIEDLRAAFVAAMEKASPGWARSPQIASLLAMAQPEDAEAKNLRHMKLEVGGAGRNLNEFQQARNSAAVLPDYGIPPIWAAAPASAASSGAGRGAPVKRAGPAPVGGGSLFKTGDRVADEGGDGVVTHDQKPGEDFIWVSFEGEAEERIAAKDLRRI